MRDPWEGIRQILKLRTEFNPSLICVILEYGDEHGLLDGVDRSAVSRELRDYLPHFYELRPTMFWSVWFGQVLLLLRDLTESNPEWPDISPTFRPYLQLDTEEPEILMGVARLLGLPLLPILQDNLAGAFSTVRHPPL